MKKIILTLTVLVLVLSACGKGGNADKTLKVAVTLDPHSKIVEFAKPILKDKYDIDVEVKVLDDFYIFNEALNSGEIDVNYFQHVPFFNSEVADKGYEISNIGGVHIEPFGFYSSTIESVEELKDGDTIVISTSTSDYGRLLDILSKAGVIKLKEGADLINGTLDDIEENPKNLKFIEVKPELLSLAYENKEGALVAINGNYAITAGLNPVEDAVILEEASQENPFVNIIACKKGNEDVEKIKDFVEVLQSEEVKNFITETYTDGSVIPAK